MHYVYILSNKARGTLYTGSTNNLVRRVYEHKEKLRGGFSKNYNTDRLVFFEVYEPYVDAAKREKQLKKWNRAWRIELIEEKNPQWVDLYEKITR